MSTEFAVILDSIVFVLSGKKAEVRTTNSVAAGTLPYPRFSSFTWITSVCSSSARLRLDRCKSVHQMNTRCLALGVKRTQRAHKHVRVIAAVAGP